MAMEETAIRVGKRRARAERDRMTAEDATGERERQRWRRERTRMTVALRAARATRERDRMVAQDALSRAARERERHEERSRRRALRESARRRPSTVEGCPLPAPPAGDDPILASLALKPGAGVPIAPSCDLPVRVPLCGSLPEQRPALICEQASRRHGRLYETLPAFAARRERFFALRIQRWWVHVRPRCRAARHVQAWYRGRRNRRQCLGILRGTRTGANGDPIERLDDSFFDFLQDDGSDVLALLESGNVVFADTPGGSPRAPPCEGQATEPPRQLPMPGGHRSPSPDGTRSSPVPAPSRLDSAPGECAKSACDDVFGGSTTNESVDGGLAASESGCAIDELGARARKAFQKRAKRLKHIGATGSWKQADPYARIGYLKKPYLAHVPGVCTSTSPVREQRKRMPALKLNNYVNAKSAVKGTPGQRDRHVVPPTYEAVSDGSFQGVRAAISDVDSGASTNRTAAVPEPITTTVYTLLLNHCKLSWRMISRPQSGLDSVVHVLAVRVRRVRVS
ncbi:Uncharacterized protein PBTT_07270 [Plasmodiophora brassicae]|uniref:Uncharacterized protein n=1 Tax=Plasmodiophora brassicae TaxID=37360 RepID=A0A0G4J7A2_PLABS|nr:hypothetical protein PBRA_009383 [Plasmodiophora brassicae]